jgi:hypothetical protein
MIYKVNIKCMEMMGYGASCNLKSLQLAATNAPNPSYVTSSPYISLFSPLTKYLSKNLNGNKR